MKKMNVVVTSATPLTAAQTSKLVQAIEQKHSAFAIELTQKLDPQLLGGLKVKVAGQLLDASIASTLQKLAQQL
jgi:F-type H+-transporting ATPase subunit delta